MKGGIRIVSAGPTRRSASLDEGSVVSFRAEDEEEMDYTKYVAGRACVEYI